MARNNSTNLFGNTPYVVSASSSQGSYTTIQSAINAASTAGGGLVFIKPGTYTENLTIPNNVSIQGSGAGTDQLGLFGFSNTTVFGSHTINVANSTVNISDIFWGAETSGTNPTISISPSSGTSNVNIFNCIINDSFNFNANLYSIYSNPSGASVNLTIEDCIIDANNTCIALGTNSVVSVKNSRLIASSGVSNVDLNSLSSVYNSYYNTYIVSSAACFHFTANGSVISIYDNINSTNPTGYFADSIGSFGSISFADIITIGSAKSIDPQISLNLYSQTPDVYPTSNGQVVIGRTGNVPIASTLTAGSGVAITNGAGSVTIASLPYTAITANQTLAISNGYFVTSGSLSLALPSSSVVGDKIEVILAGGTSWTITQAAGQQIFIGNQNTTLGTGGSLASTANGDSVSLVCITANTTWYVKSSMGNITIV